MRTPEQHAADLLPDAPLLLISNGTYSTVLTPTGTGFSMYGNHLLSSWQDDPCEDEYGFTIYVRDRATGARWTACGAGLADGPARVVTAGATGAMIACQRNAIETTVRLEVLRDAAVERRTLSLTNRAATACTLEVTAYVEIVLNEPAAHDGHPAFSKLFVQTARIAGRGILVATRRPRADSERHPAVGLALAGAPVDGWETDRARFVGRGRSVRDPAALTAALSGTLGNVLDPVLALRATVRLDAGQSAELLFSLIAAENEGGLAALLDATGGAVVPVPIARPAVPGSATAASDAAIAPLIPAWTAASRGSGRPHRRVAAPSLAPSGPAAVPARDGNGFGEFVDEGREYLIRVRRDDRGVLALPPMPWTNVIANERFGLIASEKGSLCTFAGNSRLHRITPWRNDPIVDPHDEAFYVRDEASGTFWSALPGPAPLAASYQVRHGFGYSVWEHSSDGLAHEVTVFVPRRDALRIAVVRIRNPGAAPRSLSLYAYQRWVLGASAAESRELLRARADADREAVLAQHSVAGALVGTIAFAAFSGTNGSPFDATIDRRHFLGTPGFADAPRAVAAGGPLGRGDADDPCAALRVLLVVPAGGEIRISALLGEADSVADLDRLLTSYRQPGAVDAALSEVREYWGRTLTATQIRSPAPHVDVMVNGWLGYQTIACRLWARSAFYQSGGAYGFRDQLQDAAALVQTEPQLLREQLVRSAAHQFAEGDVLHWWHPPRSEGIRTKFADDLVWLPYLTAYYVRVTGDVAVLDAPVPFVTGPTLATDEDERLIRPGISDGKVTLYEHCVRALRRAMTKGERGLPLFGCGDWNDGMNRVGRAGRGESVWMGFFLYAALGDFLPLSRRRDDAESVARFGAFREDLEVALNDAGWDGAWYRRGYYDNGQPLGSRHSDECRIDALAQAWAVISGVATGARATTALDSLERHLVSEHDRLIRLLAPPFEHTREDPGYIKGYVAGVRENGGQYTHAALWVVRALAEAGRRQLAARLLSMLSPVSHAADAAGVDRYKVEPYVVAADVYGTAPHVGRGGWTWYTGSAGWMLRVALESVLGFGIVDGAWLTLSPRIPDDWPGFQISHRRPDGTQYALNVDNPSRSAERVVAASVDGQPVAITGDGLRIPLANDGRRHLVTVTLGPRRTPDGTRG